MLGIADKVVEKARETLTGQETVSGGELIARLIAAEGVERVFGIIDGTYFGFYSSLGKLGVALVSPRCEQSAAHMAAAYARLTGKLGVAMASNGPGVAAVLPGIAVEHAEGNRVLLVTSARRHQIIDPDRGGTFQCFPHTEVTRPMVKWAATVPSFDRLIEVTRAALRASWRGRPGVVHLDVPEDILNGRFPLPQGADLPPHRYRAVEPARASKEQVERAADLLADARLVAIHAGSGIIHAAAYRELDEVAKLLHAPVTTSWAARAAVDERESYAVPMTAIEVVNRVRNQADAILALGSRIGETDWWGKAPYWRSPAEQTMVQVDIDEETLGRTKPADLAIVSCVKGFLQDLAAALRARAGRIDVAARKRFLEDTLDRRAAHRTGLDKKHLADRASPLHPAHVPALCRKLFADDAVVVFDGGNTSVWGHFFHEVRRPGTIVGTPKMGMLGAGVGQALGAKVALPEREVYCLIGDGAFGYHLQELETARRCGLKVTFLVLCDKQWGMVKMNQSFTLRPLKTLIRGALDEGETINADFHDTDYAALARTMGVEGERVATVEALEEAIRRAIGREGPSVIHVDVDPVKHMWAPGLRQFKDMHGEPRG